MSASSGARFSGAGSASTAESASSTCFVRLWSSTIRRSAASTTGWSGLSYFSKVSTCLSIACWNSTMSERTASSWLPVLALWFVNAFDLVAQPHDRLRRKPDPLEPRTQHLAATATTGDPTARSATDHRSAAFATSVGRTASGCQFERVCPCRVSARRHRSSRRQLRRRRRPPTGRAPRRAPAALSAGCESS